MTDALPPAAAPVHAVSIQLCLASHTNTGKTALARTLLAADVGQVQDAPHVTQTAERHRLLASPEGDALWLWDTPGFGDSLRLYKRLATHSKPMAWFMSQVWDRLTDKPFFLAQTAVRAARDEADVLLYLVNASEAPQDAGYLEAELGILAWMGKPVLVVLNQLGPAGTPEQEQADLAAWRAHLAPHTRAGRVQGVLALDAFARCWLHERSLWQALRPLLAPPLQAGFDRLVAGWEQAQAQRLDAAMRAVAQTLVAAAAFEVQGDASGSARSMGQTLKHLGASVRERWRGDERAPSPSNPLAEQLMARITQDQQALTRALLSLHGLDGQGDGALWQAFDARYLDVRAPMDVQHAGILGAIAAGAATGIGADAMAGGLTLGAGALIGAVLGAIGASKAARAHNNTQGVAQPRARLSNEALRLLAEVSLLRYLAVAHFGRGRGRFVPEAAPMAWQEAIRDALAPQWPALAAALAAPAREAEAARLLSQTMHAVLKRLYPPMAP